MERERWCEDETTLTFCSLKVTFLKYQYRLEKFIESFALFVILTKTNNSQ